VVALLAHRGAGEVVGDNTIEAFCEARRLGVDGVELDVRRSADGGLVVHHDPHVEGLGPLIALPVADLPPEVPLLEAAIVACGDLVVNIELKELPGEPGYDPDHPLAGSVARFVLERGLESRVIVSSFDLRALDAVHAVDPAIATGWLTSDGYDQHEALVSVLRQGHQALHPYHQAVTAELVSSAHASGIAIRTWTVDDPRRALELAGAGVDAIITNRPALLRRTPGVGC